ncbi:hypothetical protein QCA50_008730 [Cerrena zonata]|uniref:Uncharacterized protein n=1 Tax=Cerrena zonata TaxID=2478898 RepID=A0AAW0G3T4_9APHY
MPHQHSELANWDGSVSRPRVRQPFPAVAHTPAQSQAQFQESPANPHQRNAFSSSSHMSSDDSATDIARTEQMLLARVSSEDMAISSINESDVGKRQNAKNPNTDLVSNTRTHSDPTNLHGTQPNGKPAGNTALSPSSLENSALPNHSMLLEISSSEHDLILKESMATSGDLRAQRPAQVASEASIL